MRNVTATVLAAISAYAFSFAIDLLLGALIGIYPSTAFLPVVTWSVAATGALVLATVASRRRILLAAPFATFGLLALFGAVVGTHPHSYGVAALLLAQAVVLWRLYTPPRSLAGDALQ